MAMNRVIIRILCISIALILVFIHIIEFVYLWILNSENSHFIKMYYLPPKEVLSFLYKTNVIFVDLAFLNVLIELIIIVGIQRKITRWLLLYFLPCYALFILYSYYGIKSLSAMIIPEVDKIPFMETYHNNSFALYCFFAAFSSAITLIIFFISRKMNREGGLKNQNQKGTGRLSTEGGRHGRAAASNSAKPL